MTTSQAYSRPARLYQIASWIIAVIFAVFLNMLGNLVIRDMEFAPRGGPPTPEQFINQATNQQLDARRHELQLQQDALAGKQETISAAATRAGKDYADAKEAFQNWIATRTATGNSTQDPDIIARTRKLDALQATVAKWEKQRDGISDEQHALEVQQAQVSEQIDQEQAVAQERFGVANQRYELKVFGYRLLLTLPILLIAVWLFIRFRKVRYWPFVYGFGLFALSAFFIELVPYLPNFGGYVRVLVGIVLTVFAGIYLLRVFQRYVDRKREEMQRSQSDRASAVDYGKALSAHGKKFCPSCDKSYSVGGEGATFCIHCGLKLFEECGCGGRNFAFFPFCNQCGNPVVRTSAGNEVSP